MGVLLARTLLDVDKAFLLDPDEQRVHGALSDIGEALARSSVVISYPYAGFPVRRARTMPSSVPLSISVICLPMDTSSNYSALLPTGT